MTTNYWTRRAISRRAAIRGTGVGIAGLAGAALIGCGSDDDGDATPAATAQGAGAGGIAAVTATATATMDANATPVPADQVRVPPGLYNSPVPPSAAEMNPEVNAKYGGTLLMRYLDPPRMDINRTLSCTIYETMEMTNAKLLRGKSGANAHPFLVEIEGDMAESWEANPDNTEFTFHLRPGIKTHNVDPTNGRVFTSEDVKLSLERYQAGGTQKDVYSGVTSIAAPDENTIVITLGAPNSDFPASTASWSFLWPRELIEDDDRLQEQAVGTGPFIQAEWTKKERSVFDKHPDYFEDGHPFVDQVITSVQSDLSVQRAGFLTDNFFDWNARDDLDQESMQNEADDVIGWRLPISRGANVNGWHFQMTNPIFQDERVRRAISLAANRDEFDLADNAGDNQNPEGAFSNPPMPWAFLYDEQPTAKANGPWYQFDPQQATDLLAAAGYTADNPLQFEHVTWYDRTDSGEILIPGINDALQGVVDISFRQVDNPTQVTLLSDRNFDATIGIVWGPPGYAMDQWIYPWYYTSGGLNYNAKGNAELDGLLDQQRAVSDIEERKAIWQQVWDIIHDQVWDWWWPEANARRNWHNYMLNYRGHGLMGNFTCYNAQQSRAIWLDDGAPGLDR